MLITVGGNFLLFGQTGKISGRVVEKESGEPVPLANVLLLGETIGASADFDGYYQILNIRPGNYSLKVSSIGYRNIIIHEVMVNSDLTTKFNFELEFESIDLGEDVVIIAEKPLIKKDLTASTSIINSEDIMLLPVTESQEVLELQAGVVGGNVRGGRNSEVQYSVDGVSMTDVYNGLPIINFGANSIQELQFISGAFNAEYGKAMSGVVNLTTKEGKNNYTGFINIYFGDHYTNRNNIYPNSTVFKPFSIRNYEGSFSGPIVSDKLFFYGSARYIYSDGWYKSKRKFNPWDITINHGPTETIDTRYDIQMTGDGKIVPLNWHEKLSLFGKVTYNIIPTIKVRYTNIYEKIKFRGDYYPEGEYDHTFTYNPDGDLKRFKWGIAKIFGLNHTLNSSTFYQLNIYYFHNKYQHYVYEDIENPLYTHSKLLDQQPGESPSFKTGGTNNERFKRLMDSYSIKFDLTSQLSRYHEIKTGFEITKRKLTSDEISLLQWIDKNDNGKYDPGEDEVKNPQYSGNPFVKMRIPDINDPNENLSINESVNQPLELSVYIQDKIELTDFIVNIGLRFDYFEPDGIVLNDPSDPDIYRPRKSSNLSKTPNERKKYWYKDASPKYKLSPRLGIAFPITENGVIHFSYGHFFQIPNYRLLYLNSGYKFGYGSQNLGLAGNADLNPEQTISGEIGLQQAFFDIVTVDLTAYFRDIRDLAGTRLDEIRIYGGAGSYSQFFNSDFGFVKGIILSLKKRLQNNWSASVDYTLQSAKGNASDPEAYREQFLEGNRPEVQLVPLDWDQTHTLNVTFNYISESGWGLSMVANYGGGFPYTPSQSMNISELLINSELKPSTFNIDLRLSYQFMLSDIVSINVYTNVYNLLDIKNQRNVYDDSGTADYTYDEYLRKKDDKPEIVNTVNEYYRNPSFYAEPRKIEFGTSINF